MGRVKDLTIDKMDEYYATQQNEPEPVKEKVNHKLNYIGQLQKERDLYKVQRDVYKSDRDFFIAERDFYKARFEWERARVYKAWKDDPWARRRLAYKRRWKQ
jgi:hypothetical protein